MAIPYDPNSSLSLAQQQRDQYLRTHDRDLLLPKRKQQVDILSGAPDLPGQPVCDRCVGAAIGQAVKDPKASGKAQAQHNPASELDQALSSSQRANVELHEAIDALEQRLQQVMRPAPEDPTGRAGEGSGVELVNVVLRLAGRTQDAHDRLRQILDRLAL